MPALSFKKQFITPILKKVKRQTIRTFRKIPIKVDDRIYLYTAMRTKQCEKFGEAICLRTETIRITETGISIQQNGLRKHYTEDLRVLNAFAKSDGFKDWEDMIQWWKKNHGPDCFPFFGTLIEFKLLPKREWIKK